MLDLIDKCPGLSMEQNHWLSCRVKGLAFDEKVHGVTLNMESKREKQHDYKL